MKLRKSGFVGRLLVMGYVPARHIATAAEACLSVVVYDAGLVVSRGRQTRGATV